MLNPAVILHHVFSVLLFSSVGNKNDDPNSKVVETNDAQKFAEQMGIRLFETSAKENINVEEVSAAASGHTPRFRTL